MPFVSRARPALRLISFQQCGPSLIAMGRPSLEQHAERRKSIHGEKLSGSFEPSRGQDSAMSAGFSQLDTGTCSDRRRSCSNYSDEGRASLHRYASRRSQEIEEINQAVYKPASSTPVASSEALVHRFRAQTDAQFLTCRNLESFLDAPPTLTQKAAPLPWTFFDTERTGV